MEVYRTDFAVRAKADKSPVTEADERAEAYVLQKLGKLAPGIPAVGEELYAAGGRPDISGGRFWLVDALDGTTEFTKRGEDFTVNIALIEKGAPVLGVVHAPALALTFWGSPAGAFRSRGDGAAEHIQARLPAADGLVSLTSKSHRSQEDEFLKDYAIKADIPRGSSLKLCLLAAGHAVLNAAGGSIVALDGSGTLRYGKANVLNPTFVARGRMA